jgi:hypothetical protein
MFNGLKKTAQIQMQNLHKLFNQRNENIDMNLTEDILLEYLLLNVQEALMLAI